MTLDATTFNKPPSPTIPTASTPSSRRPARASPPKTKNLSTTFTDSLDGQLVQRTTSLKKNIKDLDASNQRLQDHVDAYKAQLQAQFATMESLIAGYNSIGTFLSNSAAACNRSK